MAGVQSIPFRTKTPDIFTMESQSSNKSMDTFNNLSKKSPYKHPPDVASRRPFSVNGKYRSTSANYLADQQMGKGTSDMHARLSPRVKVGVELSIMKGKGLMNKPDVKQTTLNYLKSRINNSRDTSSSESVHSDCGTNLFQPQTGDTSVSLGIVDNGLESDSSATSLSSSRSRGSSTRNTHNQRQQQLHAYVAWVNSQLKRKPGVRPVEDLRNDAKDGVVLIELIEIVAGDKLPGVHMVPSTYSEMQYNVEQVLHYMATRRIRMHHTSAKDIVDGNLKAIMRLILALAAHFKPQSVKHSSSHHRSLSQAAQSPNATGIAQGASAALAEARRNAAKAGSRSHYKYSERRRTYHGGSSSDPLSDSDQSFSFHGDRRHKGIRGRDEGDGASADKSPLPGYGVYTGASQSSATPSPPASKHLLKSKSTDHISSKDSGTELEDNTTVVDRSQYEDLLNEYQELSVTMTLTKKELLRLQDLLLSGEPPDGEEREVIGACSPTEEVVILKSQLVQSSEVCKDLKEELSSTKNECMQLQGTKAGLHQRLMEQDETISELKAEILRRDFERQHFESDLSEIQKKCQEKDKTILDLRKDMARRDQRTDQLQNEVQLQIQEKESITRTLKMQISELHDRLRKVGQTGANLSARVASQDKRMARLEGKILQSNNSDSSSGRSEPHTGFGNGDELQVVRDSLHSLRLSFKATDPQQHTIDTLEQSVSALLDKIQISSNSSVSSGHSQSGNEMGVSRRLNFDSTGDVRRSPITSIPGSSGSFSLNHLDGPGPTTSSPKINTTKVLYFTDKSISPYTCTIPKRLGDITLKDFKAVHDHPGSYRYSFKALDPEFGTVKEEIMCDTDIIPGWEGKIVAWIEEDTG